MVATYADAVAQWADAAPTFSFKQVEAILASVFEVAPEKRKAFTARLQQMQKLGLPAEVNVGRGKRVAYQGWQLCELQFYLDLIDAGVTPALIASRFGGQPFYAGDGPGRFGETAAKTGRSYFVHVRFNAIEHLTLATASVSEVDAAFNSSSLGPDVGDLVSAARGEPGIVIDLGRRLASLKTAIDKAEAGQAGKDLFMHMADEQED